MNEYRNRVQTTQRVRGDSYMESKSATPATVGEQLTPTLDHVQVTRSRDVLFKPYSGNSVTDHNVFEGIGPEARQAQPRSVMDYVLGRVVLVLSLNFVLQPLDLASSAAAHFLVSSLIQ